MENKAIASLLYETADLLEIDGQDVFRIRSYRRAAEAIDALPQQVRDLIQEPKRLLEVPGIGKGMLTNLQELFASGTIGVHADLLVTGKACETEESRQQVMEHILLFPGLTDVIARGDNKISFHLRNHMQVDVRLLAAESFGAALVYFTGSKSHNILLRQRALKMGFTLNEYDLARLDDEKRMASKTEEDIYTALKLDYIPPELRESLGEIEAAEKHTLPELITVEDLRGDVHMHTIETDGKNTIEEMAEAARERGYEYMAITDHSKNLAMANWLDDALAVQHIARIREVD